MALEVQIEKRLPAYTLSVAFATGAKTLAVLGPSGAGKTMTLRCIAGLERPDSGRIVLNNRVLFDSAKNINVPSRDRRVGLLFQSYALFPHLTVAENIAFGLDRIAPYERLTRTREQISALHLDGLENRRPRELSGGEQQRAALARALAIAPEALLLDEPLSALDTHLRSQIEHQLLDTLSAYRGAALLVTHNIEEAYRLGSDLLVLSKGQAAAFGPKEEIFRHPPTVEVARLTGCKNFSAARNISTNEIEATGWRCRLRVTQAIARPATQVGIRAHQIDFLESHNAGPNDAAENVFPCWPISTSETPFRITLYLKLHTAPAANDHTDLQAEVFKEKFQRFKDAPLPWHVRLAPESLIIFPE
ncbi:MAG: sulfate/molybdate ABC transporter ATP-binding protein [Candidatus Acidiferrales bacterium]